MSFDTTILAFGKNLRNSIKYEKSMKDIYNDSAYTMP